MDYPLLPWKVALIDDEDDVISISEMVLKRVLVDSRPLMFLKANSAEEAKVLFEQHADIALALVDVVMEDDHAGLDLVKWIRESKKNTTTRLVLRTGQPGEAPEEDVIRDYDINDYKNKTELNSTRLKTTIYAAIRSYRDIIEVKQGHKGLEDVVSATTRVLQASNSEAFCVQVLKELKALLGQAPISFYLHYQLVNALGNREQILLSYDGDRYDIDTGLEREIFPGEIREKVNQALTTKRNVIADGLFCKFTQLSESSETVVSVTLTAPVSELTQRLLNVMLTKISIIFENLTSREDIERTQQELMCILGEAIEKRSKETGSHVRRVSLICEFLGQRSGLDEHFVQLIKYATPMHDIGKIAIPESILHKPGKLDEQEWEVMKTHAQVGFDLLYNSKRALPQVGARIALYHHEKWDGSGYPAGLKGEDIPIEGRIMAIADVIDALAARRSYKEPWPAERILALLKEERGRHFDPQLCDLAIEHFDSIMALRAIYPDDEE
ncbi:HD domain-containing phosphohydrolase [Marinobacterium lutimaris]|uniref:Response regulator c-di-GMP phosphodiesterase, RpfG family, contains REC and HD-GYP domains n=1 Tax=Marinobacterium lutimaris TaxID=568106 RepID=A0A1H6C5J1_9GAMM|nr:HD domain-containing phosphohydrolase [Marinobacterium lutimaris]SEG67905.1 Response regulator c-di-GMP phosphodiesterase, RpfG family, contains REC and HD-GYP domains [Marinobacterium lutimaris]